MHDDYDDADRYDSAEGWDPDAPRRKAAAERIAREFEKNDPGFNPFALSPGARATAGPPPKPPAQLFGPLWHQGELAILFAPASTGKSILAVQIAAQIARGHTRPRKRVGSSSSRATHRGTSQHPSLSKEGWQPAALRPADGVVTSDETPHAPATTAKPQKVLYFDFERTPAQFAERYSAPHPLPGKLPLRHRFPANFIRADLAPPFDLPARFRGDMHRYLLYWLRECVEETGARVVVIDNLAYLTRTLAGRTGTSLIKTLKLWAAEYNLSILAVTHAKQLRNSPPGLRRGGTASVTGWCSSALKPASLTDLAGSPAMADLADSVFTLAPSLLAPDLRYIKLLKSRRTETDPQTVLTCQLGRNDPRDHVASSTSSSALIPHSALPTPHSLSPFLGLTFLGLAPEYVHLTDPFAQPRRTEKRVTHIPHSTLHLPHS